MKQVLVSLSIAVLVASPVAGCKKPTVDSSPLTTESDKMASGPGVGDESVLGNERPATRLLCDPTIDRVGTILGRRDRALVRTQPRRPAAWAVRTPVASSGPDTS